MNSEKSTIKSRLIGLALCAFLANLTVASPTRAQGNAQSDTGIANTGKLKINGSVIIGNTLGTPPFQECSKNYLQLQLEDRVGTLVVQGRDSARRFRLTVGNPTNDCTAIVRSVAVEVVDYVEDHHGATEALMSKFKYKVTVSPTDKGKIFPINGDDRFTYPPHSNPDQFILDVFSYKSGYSYALRFNVDWTDLRTKITNRAQSWIAIASFPDSPGGNPDDTNAWRRDQLGIWRKQYDKSEEALKDANVEDTGSPREQCDEIKVDATGEHCVRP